MWDIRLVSHPMYHHKAHTASFFPPSIPFRAPPFRSPLFLFPYPLFLRVLPHREDYTCRGKDCRWETGQAFPWEPGCPARLGVCEGLRFGSHPSSPLAFAGSPSKLTTSVGRKNSGDTRWETGQAFPWEPGCPARLGVCEGLRGMYVADVTA